MKYFIFSAFIAAIVAILLLAFYTSLSKTDKTFLIFLIVVFIVGGYYFKVRDEQYKNELNIEQGISLDTTLANTKDLKKKSDEIINNLEASIDNVVEINKRINASNKSLGKIEGDIKEQIKLLERNINLTQEFEKKVSQQLEIKKEEFSAGKAKLLFPTESMKFSELPDGSNRIGLKFNYTNVGERPAMNIYNKIYYFLVNEKGQVKHIIRNDDGFTYKQLNSNQTANKIVEGDLPELDEKIEVILIITSQYADYSEPEEIIHDITFIQINKPINKKTKFFLATEKQKINIIAQLKLNTGIKEDVRNGILSFINH